MNSAFFQSLVFVEKKITNTHYTLNQYQSLNVSGSLTSWPLEVAFWGLIDWGGGPIRLSRGRALKEYAWLFELLFQQPQLPKGHEDQWQCVGNHTSVRSPGTPLKETVPLSLTSSCGIPHLTNMFLFSSLSMMFLLPGTTGKWSHEQ